MGLKPTRNNLETNNSFFCNQTATMGGIVSLSSTASGIAMDQSEAAVHYDSTPSGAVPLGVLLETVVNEDLTDKSQNYAKTTAQLGGKVTYAYQGEVTTDMITSGLTIVAGETAYLDDEGLITNVLTGLAENPKVGKFLSAKDENGYAKFKVEL